MKYRKKPIVVEAIKFIDTASVYDMCIAWKKPFIDAHLLSGSTKLEIYTSEGTVTARPQDWIIKGVAGEFYPCRADIFEATYEKV
jgi:hypothetical protein